MQRSVLWLQGITLVWMLAEAGISLYASFEARSPVLLAFGADSGIEFLSASVVLLAAISPGLLSERRASRWAAYLLFLLAGIIAATSILSIVKQIRPETSRIGIGITIAALLIMPLLAWLKRRTAIATNNQALAADAVESATCAYMAGIALAGLAINAVFYVPWIDSAAALTILPLLIIEGRRSLRGESCNICR
jgi:divalent metal cation (Fe/Co/Zn/Cd) transporter